MIIQLFALSASFAVWAVVFARWYHGFPALDYRERNPVRLRGVLVLAAGLIWFGSPVLLSSVVGHQKVPSLETVQVSCASNMLTLLAVAGLLKFLHGHELDHLGLRMSEPPDEVVNGVVGFFASMLPVLLVLVATLPLRDPSKQHAFLQLLRSDSRVETILWITLAVTLFAPLTEELLFRVILQGSLQSRVQPAYAVALSAIVFSAIHGWPDSLGLVPLALILGYVFYRRNSYLAVVILHALFNLTNLLMALSES